MKSAFLLLVFGLAVILHVGECVSSTETTKSVTERATSPSSSSNKTTTATTTKKPKTTATTTTKKTTTTTATTTTKKPNTTTTATTTPGSTTTLPAAVPRFAVKSGNKTCLMLQGYIRVSFNYSDEKGKAKILNSMVPEKPMIKGNCSNSSDRLNLSWKSEKVTLNLTLWFNKTKSDYSLSNVLFKYSGLKSNVSSGNSSAVLHGKLQAPVGTSYICSTGLSIAVGNMSLSLGNVLVAAFMNTTRQPPYFPRIGIDCAALPTTTSAATTTTVATSTTTSAPLSPGAIAGIVVGSLAFVAIVIVIIVCVRRRNGSAPYREMHDS